MASFGWLGLGRHLLVWRNDQGAVLLWAVSPPWLCHPIRVAILARYPRPAPRAGRGVSGVGG